MKSFDDAVRIVKEFYYKCPNIEDHKCQTWWRHEDCYAFMSLLFLLTGDENYILDTKDFWERTLGITDDI